MKFVSALLLALLAACGGGGSGSGDEGIDRSAIDLTGGDAAGKVDSLDAAVGAASSYLQASAIGPALGAVLSASSSAAKRANVTAKAAQIRCSNGGGYSATDAVESPDGSIHVSLEFDDCVYQNGPYLDGPLTFYCDKLDTNGACTHFSEFDFGTAAKNLLVKIADDPESATIALTLLGKIKYPFNADSGTQQLQVGLYQLDSAGKAGASAGFSVDETYVLAAVDAGTSETHAGTFQASTAAAALGCGSGQFMVSTPVALVVDDEGSYSDGKLVLSSSSAVTVEFADGQATVSLGEQSKSLSVSDLLAVCGG